MRLSWCLALLLPAFGLPALAAPGIAQEAPSEPQAEEEQEGPRITFHGFLSQAYAASDGLQFFGITKDGTADYRTAALQIRADITADDIFVVQLSHERLAESPLMAFRQDVEIDWLFYERQFGPNSIKVGRVQIPFGIYNEVRDVGVVLPFFRPSLDFYGESSFNSETVDGVVLSRGFKPWGSWSLDANAYYGEFEFVGYDTEYYLAQAKDAHGIEIWLQTPLRGLRIGAGSMRFDLFDSRNPDLNNPHWAYHFSVAGSFGRLQANTEYNVWDSDLQVWKGGYLHLGYRITEKVTLNGQVEVGDFEIKDFVDMPDYDENYTLGVAYSWNQGLVLKAEHHWNDGYYSENPLPDLFGPSLKTRYWILSLSTSF